VFGSAVRLRLNDGMKSAIAALMMAGAVAGGLAGPAAEITRFQFPSGPVKPGFQPVAPGDRFTPERGYGFDFGTRPGGPTDDQPFYFSVALPEGNYHVAITFGDAHGATTNTVKAELRRLMLEHVVTRPGEFVTRTITVNLRTPAIAGGDHVHLKPREKQTEMVDWDDKLTLEFNGSRPGLAALAITPAKVPTVFILGDSTVCDQPLEPWNSWGQMLTRFFGPDVALANHAESGESIRSSLGARRFVKVFSLMQPGDWLLLQYGHNDMKDKATNALATYQANLEKIVAECRAKGGTPVLITSMERKAGLEHDTLAGYPQTVRDVAREQRTALIDLHAMSRVFYRALGSDLDQAFQDGTHHKAYGSYELAKCVAEGLHADKLPLAKFLTPDFTGFDPAKPDPVGTFAVPASPMHSDRKPDGN
jgi:lysophospholipase L1-like esterase